LSKKLLYTGLKADLLTVATTKANGDSMFFKTVELWRNNLERENEEQPFLYPACFIEFLPSTYKELTLGIQQYDMIVRLHICFESYLDEDIDILELVEATFSKVQEKQYEYFGKLLRREETQNFDHPNVQDYMQDYVTLGKDYRADKRPMTPASPTLVTTGTFIDPF
jgi:hypothetical protein